MKAAPLLRAWLQRLRGAGVRFPRAPPLVWLDAFQHSRRVRDLHYSTPAWRTSTREAAAAVVLALGGGSWPRLGSDGRWCAQAWHKPGLRVAPLRPANCGFDVGWSPYLQ
jgi:predicted flavoprotein YhiN